MAYVDLNEARAFFRSFIDDGADADPSSVLAPRPVPPPAPAPIGSAMSGVDMAVASIQRFAESPIEVAIGSALVRGAYSASRGSKSHELVVNGWGVYPQYDLRWCRLDFAIVHPDGDRIDIEADGHEYHERTATQATADRKRDRRLTFEGWRVLRFTGAEIHASAEKCAAEILQFMQALRSAAGMR